MTNKEKVRKFENWLNNQLKEAAARCKEADDSGNSTTAFVEAISATVLLQVMNKFSEIERRGNEKAD